MLRLWHGLRSLSYFGVVSLRHGEQVQNDDNIFIYKKTGAVAPVSFSIDICRLI
ncbi:MAG: hypothetical protein U9Q91_07750 [Candidatus Marinimicrobia bacterium]|nr:hypothetical protein [Candidatus Neomarinimicrobiota bacterium]